MNYSKDWAHNEYFNIGRILCIGVMVVIDSHAKTTRWWKIYSDAIEAAMQNRDIPSYMCYNFLRINFNLLERRWSKKISENIFIILQFVLSSWQIRNTLILWLAPEWQLIYFQVTGTGGYVTPWYKFKTGHEPDSSWNILYEYLSE